MGGEPGAPNFCKTGEVTLNPRLECPLPEGYGKLKVRLSDHVAETSDRGDELVG